MPFGQLLGNSILHLSTEGIIEMSFEPPPVMSAIRTLLLSCNPRVRGSQPCILGSTFSTQVLIILFKFSMVSESGTKSSITVGTAFRKDLPCRGVLFLTTGTVRLIA